METKDLLQIIQLVVITLGFLIGLYLYNKQQKFKRLQNLSALWKVFIDKQELLALFTLMNEVEENKEQTKIEELKDFSAQTKLQYLALIEEVAIYVEAFEIDKSVAFYLFQWHFTFVYNSSNTVEAFWQNLGGKQEMMADYWSKSRNFIK